MTPPGRICFATCHRIAIFNFAIPLSVTFCFVSPIVKSKDRALDMTADQAKTTNDPDLELGDEEYDSAEDEDFELDAAQDEGSEVSSESEAEGEQPAKKKRKTAAKGKKATPGDQEEEFDSGDEVTIQKAKDRKKKKQTKGQQAKGKAGDEEDDEDDIYFDEDEEGGTGGFVRTRAMKMRTYVCSFIPVHVYWFD